MKFHINIDPAKEESVVATVHRRSWLTDQLECLVLQNTGGEGIAAYEEDDIVMLPYANIECITVLDSKTYAIDSCNRRYRLRQRLYELEQILPDCFIRINKSAIANQQALVRFRASFSGAVDAVFRCGYTEYVSRRCFAQIKRRFDSHEKTHY